VDPKNRIGAEASAIERHKNELRKNSPHRRRKEKEGRGHVSSRHPKKKAVFIRKNHSARRKDNQASPGQLALKRSGGGGENGNQATNGWEYFGESKKAPISGKGASLRAIIKKTNQRWGAKRPSCKKRGTPGTKKEITPRTLGNAGAFRVPNRKKSGAGKKMARKKKNQKR